MLCPVLPLVPGGTGELMAETGPGWSKEGRAKGNDSPGTRRFKFSLGNDREVESSEFQRG